MEKKEEKKIIYATNNVLSCLLGKVRNPNKKLQVVERPMI